jgi:uncharacterized integral membrane protein
MTEPERPIPVEEGGVQRRGSTRQFVLVAIAIGILVYLILLVVQNRRQVKVDYVVGSSHTRLIWLIVITGFLGWLLGIATSYFARRRRRGR